MSYGLMEHYHCSRLGQIVPFLDDSPGVQSIDNNGLSRVVFGPVIAN
ncbi:MAG TPA: hypothetical protein VKR59_02930 [Terriglobales bacterium]|nr:hypothetical protein [Terriglobales bacterium]